MGNALDDESFASLWGRIEGVCADEEAFGVFADFPVFLRVGDFLSEGEDDDTDRPLDEGFFLVTGSLGFPGSSSQFYLISRFQKKERSSDIVLHLSTGIKPGQSILLQFCVLYPRHKAG